MVSLQVLISTYWNVNDETRKMNVGIPGFNLNLLECKYLQRASQRSMQAVLISTYWNVNKFGKCQRMAHICFNLNLLECKC